MIDVWSSTAVKLPRLLPARLDVPLPMDDLDYIGLDYIGSARSSPTTYGQGSQLLSQMVRLNRILMEINDFNQRCVAENLNSVTAGQGVEVLGTKMQNWLRELPTNMQDTPENFQWFATRGLGRVFAAVYLGYYHFGQLLYYQFLHGAQSGPTEGTEQSLSIPDSRKFEYAKRCKAYAASLCDTIYRSQATNGADLRYTMISHVLVIASTVQIHTLFFGTAEDDIKIARKRLERNFEFLLQLRPFWPTLDRAMSRLRAFHDTARTSIDTSFVLDRWLLQFLVEFAQPMQGKDKIQRKASEIETLWTLPHITPNIP
jgi:hypothetical protein